MIDIKLKDGQSGYDVIGDYIRRYWHNNISTTVVVSIGTSYNGQTYDFLKEVACPYMFDNVEFFNDWWEGEKYLKLFGIQSVDELDITGGIYTEE